VLHAGHRTDRVRRANRLKELTSDPCGVIAGLLFVAIIGLAIWYLAHREPLPVQGEAESTRIDIAARVSERLAKIAVSRGQNIAAGTTLLVIDNPELTAELREVDAEKRWPMRNCGA
jgi:HlyD family secretion protein